MSKNPVGYRISVQLSIRIPELRSYICGRPDIWPNIRIDGRKSLRIPDVLPCYPVGRTPSIQSDTGYPAYNHPSSVSLESIFLFQHSVAELGTSTVPLLVAGTQIMLDYQKLNINLIFAENLAIDDLFCSIVYYSTVLYFLQWLK